MEKYILAAFEDQDLDKHPLCDEISDYILMEYAKKYNCAMEDLEFKPLIPLDKQNEIHTVRDFIAFGGMYTITETPKKTETKLKGLTVTQLQKMIIERDLTITELRKQLEIQKQN